MRYIARISFLWVALGTMTAFAIFSDITVAQANQVSSIVELGSWRQPFDFDPERIYDISDLVIYNGVIYESIKANNTRIPGSSGSQNWWIIP